MATLQPGDQAPFFESLDQNKNMVRLSDFAGARVLVYFYPKANTAG